MSVIKINVDNFRQEIEACEKMVLLDFWADWCTPCRMIAPILEEIAHEREDIKVAKVNVDEEPKLAGQFGIRSVPTLVILKDGNVLRQSSGAKTKQEILEMLG